MKVGEGISAFFPAYNDAPSLPGLLRRAFAALEQATGDFEVIVVNDGSRDGTAAVLEQMQQELGPRLRIITHGKNRGYGGALRSGFQAATKDLVFYTDGDGQYDPAEIHLLLEQWTPNLGLVNGYKRLRQDPWHRIVIGRIYNAVARFLFRIRIRDIDCDFRLVRRSLVENLHLESTSGTICLELVRKIEMTGCQVAEVAVNHYPRLHGRSQFFRWRSLLTTARQFARLYFRLVLLPALASARCSVSSLVAARLHRKPLA
ncbi:MAG: glycosyltransferase family 2 protein [Acidobacteriota bacterium]